jgi:glucosyl-dolichyl phosphate glucuronosyltransferase
LVSVAICTRNRSHTLTATLESVIGQDFTGDYEVLVIDDGSTDATGAVTRRFAERTARPPIRYIRQDHGGLSNARNRAVRESKGELICFIDDDAVAVPGWLRSMSEGAARHSEIDCFAGRIVLKLEGKAPRTCELESVAAELDEGPEEKEVERAKGANMALRRSGLRRVGLFNPALVWSGDEWDWQRRLNELGGSVMYVPEAMVWHRRLESDLGWSRLLRTKFWSGAGQVQYVREAGRTVRYRRNAWAVFDALRHTARERCPGGLMSAAPGFSEEPRVAEIGRRRVPRTGDCWHAG